MPYYCLKCKKKPRAMTMAKVEMTKNGRRMFSSNCGVCGSKKLRFIKEQEASGFLSSFGIKACLNQIPRIGPILF